MEDKETRGRTGERTVSILCDVKSSKNQDSFLSKVPASSFIRGVYGVLEAVKVTVVQLFGQSVNQSIADPFQPRKDRKSLSSCSPSLASVTYSPLVNAQNSSTSSKLIVFASIEYFLDTQLTQSRGTHNARFDSDVQRCI
jgi:hypothetical protein